MVIYVNPLGMRLGDLFNICKYDKLFNLVAKLTVSAYVNGQDLVDMMEVEYPNAFHHDDLTVRSKAAVDLVTDFFFLAPTTLEAEEHSKNKDSGRSTYVFEFAYRQSFHKYKPWVKGSHCDDMYSVFGEPFMQTFRERFLGDDHFSKTDLEVKTMIQNTKGKCALDRAVDRPPSSARTLLEWHAK